MRTLPLFALLITASSLSASPQVATASRPKGIDLLTADHVSDAKGNVLVVLPSKTPFDADADARKRYLDAYAAGFESGYAGKLLMHNVPSRPLVRGELEGWSAGQWTGFRSHEKEALSEPRP